MNTKKKALVLALTALVTVSTSGCSPRALVLKTVMGTVDPYFHGEHIDGNTIRKADGQGLYVQVELVSKFGDRYRCRPGGDRPDECRDGDRTQKRIG